MMPVNRSKINFPSGRRGKGVHKIHSRSSIRTLVDVVSEEAKGQGFTVLPSTQSALEHWITRGMAAGTIENDEEAATSIAAIVAAATQAAKDSGHTQVRHIHLNSGWTDHLGPTGGNCPPYKCMKRTILMRVGALRSELSGFDELLDSTLDILDI